MLAKGLPKHLLHPLYLLLSSGPFETARISKNGLDKHTIFDARKAQSAGSNLFQSHSYGKEINGRLQTPMKGLTQMGVINVHMIEALNRHCIIIKDDWQRWNFRRNHSSLGALSNRGGHDEILEMAAINSKKR